MRLTADQVRERLKAACEAAGGQSAWARRHCVEPSTLSNSLNGRRGITSPILRARGLRRGGTVFIADDAWHPEDVYDGARMSQEG
jgi:hypothetical protein